MEILEKDFGEVGGRPAKGEFSFRGGITRFAEFGFNSFLLKKSRLTHWEEI